MVFTIIILIVWAFCHICVFIKAKNEGYKKYKNRIADILFNRVHSFIYVFIIAICAWIIGIRIALSVWRYFH